MEQAVNTNCELYAIKLRHKFGPSAGRVGYHSIFAHKDTAEYCLKLRQSHKYASDFEYFIEAVTPIRVGQNYHKQTCVAFPDSVGMMLVDIRTVRDVEAGLVRNQFYSKP